MNNFRFFKKTMLSVVLASSSAMAIADQVDLLDYFSITHTKYGLSSHVRAFDVAVDNLGADKTVVLVQQIAGGAWQEFPLTYLSDTGGNKEIWSGSHNIQLAGDFAIKYTVNGNTYWDNNNNQNYDVQSAGYVLGADEAVRKVSHYFSDILNTYTGQYDFSAKIIVDNIAFNKSINLVYTTDDWSTSTVVPAVFAGPNILQGLGSYANPSANGTEQWNVTFGVDDQNFDGQFFIEYVVDGQTYYDNNFGENYKVKTLKNHDSVYLRHSLNNWAPATFSMTLLSDHLWARNLTVPDGETVSLKFDIFNDWSLNFGDNDNDGIAEQNGNNIVISTPGTYSVRFNDDTHQITVIAL